MPSQFVFVVNLAEHHRKHLLAPWSVSIKTGLKYETVERFVMHDDVEVKQLNTTVAVLCEFYGVDFHDVVKVKKISGTGEMAM